MNKINKRVAYAPKTQLGRWFDERLPLPRFLHNHIFNFLIPCNLNYLYTFGAILLFMLMSQIFSGIILAMHYVPHISLAFESKEYIRRSVNFGWLFTSMHSVGASFFFLAAYIHIGRGLYYGSYKKPREVAWIIGVLVFFCMLLIAFTGYVAAWSMVSTTAVTVISNFVSKIPLIGPCLYNMLLGGTEIGQPSLNRLYALHIVLPFILCVGIFFHIWSIHIVGQSNPSGMPLEPGEELLPFAPYGIIKDALAVCIFALIFALFVFYMPDLLQSRDSFVQGNTQGIGSNIAPEWYFMPFYTMLKAINFKIAFIDSSHLGVFTVIAALFILLCVPILDKSPIYSAKFRPLYRIAFWVFVANILLLSYLGYQESTLLITRLSQLSTAYYFSFFVLLLPGLPFFETKFKQSAPPSRTHKQSTVKKSFTLW